MSETHEKEIIEGTVEDIRFRNEQNGYTVLSVGCDDDLITAVGVFSDISVGETVKLQGEWTYHTTFGRQFKVEAFERNMPATTEQLYNYLAAGAIKGIGRATAERIVDMFGEKSIRLSRKQSRDALKGQGHFAGKGRKNLRVISQSVRDTQHYHDARIVRYRSARVPCRI